MYRYTTDISPTFLALETCRSLRTLHQHRWRCQLIHRSWTTRGAGRTTCTLVAFDATHLRAHGAFVAHGTGVARRALHLSHFMIQFLYKTHWSSGVAFVAFLAREARTAVHAGPSRLASLTGFTGMSDTIDAALARIATMSTWANVAWRSG